MPTRSIKFKLIVPRAPDKLEATRPLWQTHDVTNNGTACYERSVLLMRRGRYLTDGKVVEAAKVRHGLLGAIQVAR